MKSVEFIIWLRGFVSAVNNYNVTPRQWDDLKDQLSTVVLTEDDTVVHKVDDLPWCATSTQYKIDTEPKETVKELLHD